jgi:NitT/TauT family transport system ATP-binding protein
MQRAGSGVARLALRGVTKCFAARAGLVTAVEDIDLDVAPGEFVVLVGPSGCGKSTLLSLIAGFEQPDSGAVLEDGEPVRGPGRDRSLVFQDGALFPWLSARGNVEFGLRQMGLAARERRQRADATLALVHLARFGDHNQHELSGGMRQRVALARALALEPRVLLMDEPFSSLDAHTRDDLHQVVQEIRERTGQTIVFVTHNVREAAALGDRVVVLSARPGRVRTVVPVQIARPRAVDDVDVVTIAQRIARALRDDYQRERREEYDLDWQPAEAGVLRPLDGVLGDRI